MNKKQLAKEVTRLRKLRLEIEVQEQEFDRGMKALVAEQCPLKVGDTVEWPDYGNPKDVRRAVITKISIRNIGKKGPASDLWMAHARKYSKSRPKKLLYGRDNGAVFFPNSGSFAAGLVKVVKPLEGAEMP